MPANDFAEVSGSGRQSVTARAATTCRRSQHRHVSRRLKFRQFYQRNRFCRTNCDSARGRTLPVTRQNRTAWLSGLAAVLLLAVPAAAAPDSKPDEKSPATHDSKADPKAKKTDTKATDKKASDKKTTEKKTPDK